MIFRALFSKFMFAPSVETAFELHMPKEEFLKPSFAPIELDSICW